MIQILLGIIISRLTFTLPVTLAGKLINVQILPPVIGYFLIVLGTEKIDKESVLLRQKWVKAMNLALLVVSAGLSLGQMYTGELPIYRILGLLVTIAAYIQLLVISRAMCEIDANYFLRVKATFLITCTMVLALLEAAAIILEFISGTEILQYGVLMILYMVTIIYCLKLYEVVRAYKRAV